MAGLLVAMGVVYGDIGTSPLYVMKSIVEDNGGLTGINPDFVIGSVSLIFLDIDSTNNDQIYRDCIECR